MQNLLVEPWVFLPLQMGTYLADEVGGRITAGPCFSGPLALPSSLTSALMVP